MPNITSTCWLVPVWNITIIIFIIIMTIINTDRFCVSADSCWCVGCGDHHNSHRRCFRWIAEQNDITFIADIYISHTAAGSTHHISAQHGHKYATWQMPLHHVAKAEDGLRATINGVRWVGSSSGRNIGGWLAVAVDADADWLIKMLLRNWQWIVGTISTEHLTAAPNTHTHKHTDHLQRQYGQHC